MKMQRLRTIIQFVEKNSIVADIGTDHGVVPIYLIEENIAKKVIATDISKPSLGKLEIKLQEKAGSLNIETRCSDGLKQIRPFEVDTIIISGMGGVLIEEILSQSIETAKTVSTLILQPNNAVDHLRKWLLQNGFYIEKEKDLFENGKYYTILSVKRGLDKAYTEIEYKFGRSLLKEQSQVLKEYILKLKTEKNNILSKLKEEGSGPAKERVEELRREIDEIDEVLQVYES